MVKHKIKILQIAQDDMKSIIAYIRLDNPDTAIHMYKKINSSIGNLASFPLMGTVPRNKKIAEQGYRMIIVDPYLVFYLIVTEEKTVEIHRVIHGMRDYSSLM